MSKTQYSVLGVMSGTSLDGIDLAHVQLRCDGNWQFKICHAQTISYSLKWKDKLSNLTSKSKDALVSIDEDYTNLLAQVINDFIERNSIENLDAICSHGHTALHRPEEKLTYQLGNRSELATKTGQKVVCDFRVQDVELGGQGAPLVPIGDHLLFSQFDYCLNLGGFANTSYNQNGKRIAYDICPVNSVLNRYALLLGQDYDDGGMLASSGNLNDGLLNHLNGLSFYAEPAPKSLGLEWVEKEIIPLIDRFDLSPTDVLRTFTEHVAMQLARSFDEYSKVLVTGGGVYNTFLLERLKCLKNIEVEIPSSQIIEFKEALIFALLGVLNLRGEINCLSSVTGATQDHSSGVVFEP